MYHFNNAIDTQISAFSNAMMQAGDRLVDAALILEQSNGDIMTGEELAEKLFSAMHRCGEVMAILENIGMKAHKHIRLCHPVRLMSRIMRCEHGNQINYTNSELAKEVFEHCEEMKKEGNRLFEKGKEFARFRNDVP